MFGLFKSKKEKSVSAKKEETKLGVEVKMQILRESIETAEMPEMIVKTTMADGKVFTRTLKPTSEDDYYGISKYARFSCGPHTSAIQKGHFNSADWHGHRGEQDCGTDLNEKHVLYRKTTTGKMVTLTRKVLKLEEV